MADIRPLILLTNDDGITAPGLRNLISIMNELGNVVVVAPEGPQSGMGHAITINSTLRCDPIHIDDGPQKVWRNKDGRSWGHRRINLRYFLFPSIRDYHWAIFGSNDWRTNSKQRRFQ